MDHVDPTMEAGFESACDSISWKDIERMINTKAHQREYFYPLLHSPPMSGDGAAPKGIKKQKKDHLHTYSDRLGMTVIPFSN